MSLGDDNELRTPGPHDTEPDAEVARAAQTGEFGPLLASRDLGNPLRNALGFWVAGAVAWAVLLLLGMLFSSTGWLKGSIFEVFLAGLVFVLAFGGLAGFVSGFKTLLQGRRAWYVYRDGFVARAGGTVSAFAWQDAVSFKPAGQTTNTVRAGVNRDVPVLGAGKPHPLYALTGPDGRRQLIHSRVTDGRDLFVDELIAALQRFDKPVG